MTTARFDHDFIVVGSGFGGSVAGLRLTEKGYRVLMLEKGSELSAPDFPKTNWDLRRWMWIPWLGFRGLFKMTFFRHVTILSGVGVGGGSLGYASTHPLPKPSFFSSGSWAGLSDWQEELKPHYAEVKRMLGVTPTPFITLPDSALASVAKRWGKPEAFGPTDVAIYFGPPGELSTDPYFGGEGPDRKGCIRCGGCMLGCRYNAKNTLDKNYLYFAKKRGMQLQADTEVCAVRPLPGGGYRVEAKQGRWPFGRRRVSWTTERVVLAGGVLGTCDLLLRMKADKEGLPKLSDRLGWDVRTNSEALIGVITTRRDVDLSQGVAIGSILQVDEQAHVEPVRYPKGSGFFRLLMAPHVSGTNPILRIVRLLSTIVRHPIRVARALLVPDLAKYTSILLYMQSAEGTLRLCRGLLGGLGTARAAGRVPTASLPKATRVARDVCDELVGEPVSLVTETLLNIPTTAHILGGCTMGDSAATGVIDADHRVFGYEGLYVMDGSAISANPGVNPSLSIAALAERAVSRIPAREA